jgi:nicotinate phosphoribosyltransferase
VLAAKQFDIPVFGTMAHSYIQAHESETVAFERFAHARPEGVVFLIDTYDTEAAARKVVALAPRLKAAGISVSGVRLDSGDLIALSKSVRRILDEGGLADVTIFASGGLDEDELLAIARAKAPIDGFGIGTSLTTSSDAPAFDCAYKLQEYAGLPRRKHATGKATWPGRKQVWRSYGLDGRMAGDTLSVDGDAQKGGRLIHPVMRAGNRLSPSPTLAEIRTHAAHELERLPTHLQELKPGPAYPVQIGDALVGLAAEFDRRLEEQEQKPQ